MRPRIQRDRVLRTPRDAPISELATEAAGCRLCPLWRRGTQTVFGEGPSRAAMMFVGEQPGDREDLTGHPFVGPAGHVLEIAMEDAGIDRSQVYLTNVVKHFKWESRGKRRIHLPPDSAEIDACRVWLDAELDAVRPDLLLCLGATAAQALLGTSFRITHDRGKPLKSNLAAYVMATIHPSAILRMRSGRQRETALAAFTDDLRAARQALPAAVRSER